MSITLPAVTPTAALAARPDTSPTTFRRHGRLVALLPAHNEEATLPLALRSLRDQTVRPDRVLVVADNCTDTTVAVARDHGAEVLVTVGNTAKKAGALNQALEGVLAELEPHDLVLVMDADSILEPTFLAGARRHLGGGSNPRSPGGRHRQSRFAERPLGGVGGTFSGGPGGGLLGTFQRNEYARYARDVRRLKGKALVLTGTASVFPVHVLLEVQQARREGRVPDKSQCGDVYDTHVLTEDNELSLALMHLGYSILAPSECVLETEVMSTWGDLARQRARWKRGALENIVDYGFNRITAPYWGRQVLSAVGLVATVLYVGTLIWGALVGLSLNPFWLAVSGVFILERIVTVRSRGWRQMLLAAPLVIEMAYDLVLQAVQGYAFMQVLLRQERRW